MKDVQLDKTLEEFLRSVNKIELFKMRCAENFTEYADDIVGAFLWTDTPEGHEYWDKVSDEYKIHLRTKAQKQ